jgi:hypothetical protein
MEKNQLQTIENQSAENLDQKIEIYKNASLLKITEEEQKMLLASFDEKSIEIRPDGLIYLPQTFWRLRLNQAFGIGQWCLIVKNQTKDPQANKLYVEGVLMVRGSYMSTAVGEAEYHESNQQQSWASVWESAKSDCITRCCKDLGIASELWQPQFIRKWCADNAIRVFVKKKDGKVGVQWRKKDSPAFYNETGIVPSDQSPVYPKEKNEKPGIIHSEKEQPKNNTLTGHGQKPWLNPGTKEWDNAFKKIHTGEITMDDVTSYYRISKDNAKNILNPKFIYNGNNHANVTA